MGRAEPSLREELLAARARLIRQIELLEAPSSSGPGVGGAGVDGQSLGAPLIDSTGLIAELSGVLREIDLRLSELG
jgi:hypothetical protein